MNHQYTFWVESVTDDVGVVHYTAYRNIDFVFVGEESVPHPQAITGHGDTPVDAVLDLCAELALVGIDEWEEEQ